MKCGSITSFGSQLKLRRSEDRIRSIESTWRKCDIGTATRRDTTLTLHGHPDNTEEELRLAILSSMMVMSGIYQRIPYVTALALGGEHPEHQLSYPNSDTI
jgi:hypothetical protein